MKKKINTTFKFRIGNKSFQTSSVTLSELCHDYEAAKVPILKLKASHYKTKILFGFIIFQA